MSVGSSGTNVGFSLFSIESLASPILPVTLSRRFGEKPTKSPARSRRAATIGRILRKILANGFVRALFCLPSFVFQGRAPASIDFCLRCGIRICHHLRLATFASLSVVPHRLQKLRAGGLPSPHSPQIRSPARILRVGGCLTGFGRPCGAVGFIGVTAVG